MYKLFLIIVTILLFSGCNKNNETTKFYGNVDVRTVSLAFQVSGQLESMNFEEGQKVKKGDLIATLQSTLYKERLNQINAQIDIQKAQISKLEKGYRVEEIEKARASMNQKKALMKKAQTTLKRYEKLHSTQSISEEDYDNLKTAFDSTHALYQFAKSSLTLLKNGYEKEDILSAKAQLNVLISQKNQHQLNLDYTKLHSPSNGVVLTRMHEVGSIINASQIVVEVAKDDDFWVRSYMSEKYLGLIKQGMNAEVSTDSKNNYKGVISFISPIAEFTPKSVQTEDLRTDLVYRFRIKLNSYDEMIKQGMPVTIKFPELEIK